MKTNIWLQQIMGLVLLTILASGCGQSFKANKATPESYQTSSSGLQKFLLNYQAVSLTPREAELYGLSTSLPAVRFSTSLDVEFGDIARALSLGEKLARVAAWKVPDCSTPSPDFRSYETRYSCNEIPFGKIQDAQSKLIENFVIDPMSGSENGVSYQVSGTTVPLILKRQQYAAIDGIQHLDVNATQLLNVEEDILKNIYYRFSVEGGRLYTDVCLFSPGLTVRSTAQNIHVDAKKKVLFFYLRGSADIRIDPGTLSFSKAKVCTKFETSIANNKVDFKFKQIEAPVFTNLAHNGLDINVDVHFKGILKLLNGLARLLGINIEKKVQDKIEARILSSAPDVFEKLKKEDINTGEWLVKYVNGAVFRGNVVKHLEAGLGQANSAQGPGSHIYLNSVVEAGCVLLAKTYSKNLRGDFEKICRNSFQIRATFFADSDIDEAKGCYSSYFSTRDARPAGGQKPWWNKGCKVRNSFEIIAPEDFAPLYACIREVFDTDAQSLANVGACSEEIQWLESRVHDHDFKEFIDRAVTRVKEEKYRAGLEDLLKARFAHLLAL